MVVLGQVEQQRARLVQTLVGRHKSHRVVQQVLLRRKPAKWQDKDVFQGCVTSPELATLSIKKAATSPRP